MVTRIVKIAAYNYNWWLWRFDAVLQPQSREAYSRLLSQGWVDAARHLHPNEKVYRRGSGSPTSECR